MSANTWPAWMPEFELPMPANLACDGPCHISTGHCHMCYGIRHIVLAWYAAAKQRDPDFGHVTPPRKPLPPGTDFEAAKRAAFPLPEEADDGA